MADQEGTRGERERGARPRRRWVRRLLIVGGSVLVLLIVLLALAPTIAGAVAPGYAQDAINKQINGRATVGGVSLSWFGGQRVGPVEITDALGNPLAKVTVTLSRGLFGLARTATGGGAMDLGTATVTGGATVVRHADGTTNLQQVFNNASAAAPKQPSPSTPTQASKVPQITARLVLDKLDVQFVDESKAGAPAAVVRIPALSGTVTVDRTSSLDGTVGGDLMYGPDAPHAAAPGGSLTLTAHADSLTDASGNLTLDQTKVNVAAGAKDLAMAIADSLAGTGNRLASALGDKIQASLKAQGTLANSDATVTAASRGLNADLALATHDGVLTAPRPGTIKIDTAGLPSLSPSLQETLASGPTQFDRLPTVTVTLESVKVPLPTGGKPLDLRGASLGVSVETSEAAGSVRSPTPDGRGTQSQPFRVAPLQVRLASDDLAKGATLKANTDATIAGQSAGKLTVDLTVKDLLDESGKPRGGMPGVQGSVDLKGVATAIAQPFAEPAGVDLARDVGPQLDLALQAATGEPGASGASGAIPPTHIALDLKSANLNAAARLIADQQLIRAEQQGVELHIAQVGPLASRILKNAGVAVDSGGPIDVTVANLAIDLNRLSRAGGAAPDLRAIAANVSMQTGAISGTLTTAGQPAHAWQVAPGTASVDARDLAKGVAIKAATAATFDRAPAGTLSVDLRATGLVDASGAKSAALPSLSGRVGLTGIATAIAQPWAEAAGLDLPAGLGPRLDVQLVATPVQGGAGGGGETALPPTNLDLSIRSDQLTTSVPLVVEGRSVRGRGNGMSVALKSPGMIAGPAARKSGYAFSDSGFLTLAVKDLALVFDEKWAPRLDQSTANVVLTTGGYTVTAIGATGPTGAAGAPPATPPVLLSQLALGAHLAPGKPPGVDVQGSGTHGSAPFSVQGALALDGLFSKGAGGAVAVTPAAMRPTGKIDITNLPTSLVGLVMRSAPVSGGPDIAGLIRGAVGPAVTINLASSPPAQGAAGARDVTVALHSDHFNGGLDGALGSDAVALRKLDFTGEVTPDLAATLIDMAGPGLAERPNLVSPATITIAATPFSLPIRGGSPDFSNAADATVQVGMKGTALVNNVKLKSQSGPPRDIGSVGLQDVLLTAAVPLSSLAPGSAAKPAQVHITCGVLGAPDKKIVDLKADGTVPIAGGAPAGDLNASANLKVLDAAWLDTFLGQPGYVSGAIGPTMVVDAAGVVQFPRPAPGPAATGAGGGTGGTVAPAPAFERALLTASIQSPRLSTSSPLKATAVPDHLSLDQPLVLKWTVDPVWANANLLGGSKLPKGQNPPARFDAPLDLTLAVGKLAVGMGAGAGPLKPGVFAADVQVTSPGASMTMGDPPQVAQAKLKNLLAHIVGGKDPGTLGFTLTVDDAGGGPAPGGKPAVAFTGGIYGVADNAGNLTPSAAKVTMNGQATAVPTALVDALAKQQGVLVEALGPAVNLTVSTGGASETGGNLAAGFTSQRADAQLKGSIQKGEFVASQPVEVHLKEITPQLGERLVKSLPLVGTFEKKPEDGPATVRATNLTVPIDGDMQKLNGQVVFDMGKARFASSNVFSEILKLTGQKQAGAIGQHLDPVTVNIARGVATYDRVTIPLGEFRFQTEGMVDLVRKQMNVVTYIPAGALTDEAAGSLNSGIGKLFGGAIPTVEQATMIPFRTSGSFDKPETKPDMELFAKSAGKTLLRPDKLIGGTLDDLLKKVKPKK